jgi:hypothetical protein
VSVPGLLATVKAWGPWLLRQGSAVRRWLATGDRPHLRIVPNHVENRWVGLGHVPPANNPAMQVISRWFVTNLTNHAVRIVAVRFARRLPRTHWWRRGELQVTEAMMFSFVVGNKGAGDALPPSPLETNYLVQITRS